MPPLMLALYINALTAQIGATNHLRARHEHATERRLAGDGGQATTEYALVLLAAAMVALLVIAWASTGGGAAKISRLFNRVIDAVIDRV